MEARYQKLLDSRSMRLTFANRRIESEFRLSCAEREISNLRIQILLGMLLIIGITVLDKSLMPAEFFGQAIKLRFAIMIPPMVVMFVATFYSPAMKYMQWMGAAIGFAVGFGSMGLGAVAAAAGIPLVFSGYLIVTVYVYFLLGLRYWVATTVAMILFAAYVVGAKFNPQLDINAFMYNCLFLWFLNIMGTIGAYRIEELHRISFLEERLLHHRANHDGLTGLPKREVFNSVLHEQWAQCSIEDLPISMMVIDIDFFKPYNDIYGHQAGDRAIIAVADALKNVPCRPYDQMCRYGGEEFAFVLPGASSEIALARAEDFRQYVEDLRIVHKGSSANNFLTVSVGIVEVCPKTTERSPDGFFQLADEALYCAKQAGRNRVYTKIDGEDDHVTTGIFRTDVWEKFSVNQEKLAKEA